MPKSEVAMKLLAKLAWNLELPKPAGALGPGPPELLDQEAGTEPGPEPSTNQGCQSPLRRLASSLLQHGFPVHTIQQSLGRRSLSDYMLHGA